MKRTAEQALRDELAAAAADVERAQGRLLKATGAVDLALAARRAADEALAGAELRGTRAQDALDHLTGALDRDLEPATEAQLVELRADLEAGRAELEAGRAEPAELAQLEPIARRRRAGAPPA